MVFGRPAREGKPRSAATVEKSDEVVVPKTSTKTRVTPVELMEGRAEAEGKSAARNASSTQREPEATTFLHRIGERARQRARQRPDEKWTNLLSHIRVPFSLVGYRLRKNGATGVEEVSWEESGERLDERLLDLENRIHRGSYYPHPVRRVHIPKGDWRTRPLGMPTLEDKIVQPSRCLLCSLGLDHE